MKTTSFDTQAVDPATRPHPTTTRGSELDRASEPRRSTPAHPYFAIKPLAGLFALALLSACNPSDGGQKPDEPASNAPNLPATASWSFIHTLAIAPEPATAFALAPDRLAVAIASERNTIELVTVPDPERRIVIAEGLPANVPNFFATKSRLNWSADQKLLAFPRSGVAIWNADTSQLEQTISIEGTIGALDFSNDGAYLAVASGVSSIQSAKLAVWNISTGMRHGKFEGTGNRTFPPPQPGLGSSDAPPEVATAERVFALNPDGSLIALGGERWKLEIWDVNQGKLLHTLQSPLGRGMATSQMVSEIEWSWDGKHLAVLFDNIHVMVYDLARASWTRIIEQAHVYSTQGGRDFDIHDLCFSHSGRYLAIAGLTTTRRRAVFEPAYVSDVPDRGEVRIWDLATGEVVELLSANIGEVIGKVAFSADDQTLMALSGTPTVRFFTGAVQKTMTQPATCRVLVKNWAGNR